MKNKKFLYLSIILSMGLLIGCNGNQQSKTQETPNETKTTVSTDYSGVYESNSDGEGCNLTITITKEDSGYKYYLTGEHQEQEGVAIIEETDAIYISFDGPIGNNEPNTVSGQIEGNIIRIQNYGNALNDYHYFIDCDEKYIEFVK